MELGRIMKMWGILWVTSENLQKCFGNRNIFSCGGWQYCSYILLKRSVGSWAHTPKYILPNIWKLRRVISDGLSVWMHRKPLEEVDQFIYLGCAKTKDGTSMKEERIRPAQDTPSTDEYYWKTKPSVSHKDQTLQITCLVNTVLWMWEVDVDGGSGEANPAFWKQML